MMAIRMTGSHFAVFQVRRCDGCPAALLVSVTAAIADILSSPARASISIDGGTAVTIPGSYPSPWNAGTNLTVGSTSQGGTLTIQNGGQVTSGSGNPPVALEVASGISSFGVLVVTGRARACV